MIDACWRATSGPAGCGRGSSACHYALLSKSRTVAVAVRRSRESIADVVLRGRTAHKGAQNLNLNRRRVMMAVGDWTIATQEIRTPGRSLRACMDASNRDAVSRIRRCG